MGHAGKTVNTRVYWKRNLVEIRVLRKAIETFPSVTSHLKPRNWGPPQKMLPARRRQLAAPAKPRVAPDA
jgi:hypothetical protein